MGGLFLGKGVTENDRVEGCLRQDCPLICTYYLSRSLSVVGMKMVISSSVDFSRAFILPFRLISISLSLRSASRSRPFGLAGLLLFGEFIGLTNLDTDRGELLLCFVVLDGFRDDAFN